MTSGPPRQTPAATPRPFARLQLHLWLSHYAARYWYLVLVAGLLIDGGILALLSWSGREKRWMLSVYSCLILAAVAVLLLYVSIGLVTPLVSVQSL